MLIYIRHSKDRQEHRHPYDGHITHEGRKLARRKSSRLISRYGLPDVIYCSPFRRTRETLDSMLKEIKRTYGDSLIRHIKIVYHSSLSRFFTSREKLNPLLAESTEVHGIPVEETKQQMYNRVNKITHALDKRYSRSRKVCWVITHTIPYKIINKYYDKELPRRIPFMHSTTIRH